MKLAVVAVMSKFDRFAPEFMFSCIKQGIDPIILTDCPTWGVAKTECYLRWIRSDASQPFTHVLFCDGYDVIFLAPRTAIVARYMEMEKPIVIGAEPFCTRHPQYANKFGKGPLPYPNTGMWIAEKGMARELLEAVISQKTEHADETSRFLPAILAFDKEYWMVDAKCRIFANYSEKNSVFLDPCLVHFPGFNGSIAQFTALLGFPQR